MPKKAAKKQSVKKSRVTSWFMKVKKTLAARRTNFLERRPHRSFRLTRRRDYKRSFAMPGYWAFTYSVWQTIWHYKRTFFAMLALYSILSVALVGAMSQETYAELSNVFFGQDEEIGIIDDFGAATSALALFAGTVAGSLTHQTGPTQQIIGGFLILMTWLSVVWLLRHLMAGHKVKLRDGIYNAGAPIVSTSIVVMVIMFQLIPFALGLVAYNVAAQNGFFASGVEAMLIWAALLLVGMLSLYWITSSLVALVVVTLPGMYPFKALSTAGDLIVGRRLRLMLRLGWLALGILPFWAVILLPLIFLEGMLKIDWLPLVPTAALLLGGGTILWSATYIYLLYRILIDDETPSA